MDEQYDPKVLRKLQMAECQILEDFIELCETHDLKYWIFSGCAIGVERHKGFIPWDDDIDIGMLRTDYDRFLQIAQEEYADRYRVLEISVDEGFPFYNAEFIRRGTRNVPHVFKDANIDMGIDVAVYPFDNVAPRGIKRFLQCTSVFFWHKVRILREFGNPVLMMSGWRKKVVAALCKIIHAVLKGIHISPKFINKRYMKSATRYNDQKTDLVSCFFSTKPLECMMYLDELFPLVKKKFEYLEVCVPRDNPTSLTRLYGDYMEIPPVEKQKNHVPYILEFGEFENLEVK